MIRDGQQNGPPPTFAEVIEQLEDYIQMERDSYTEGDGEIREPSALNGIECCQAAIAMLRNTAAPTADVVQANAEYLIGRLLICAEYLKAGNVHMAQAKLLGGVSALRAMASGGREQ